MYPDKSRVCLLDPSATKELSPEDGETFDVFLFGGILGTLYVIFGESEKRRFHIVSANENR